MARKVEIWRGKLLNSGGRFVLTNFSLSASTMFLMGLYLLQDGVHDKMESIRTRFFWQGLEIFKYRMVDWENRGLGDS